LFLVSIVGTAVREGILPATEVPTPKRVWRSRTVMLITAFALAGLLWFGRRWWNSEAADYRSNRLYHPLEVAAKVRTENQRQVFRLDVTDPRFQRAPPLVPDHGKLMHLFLIREPNLDAFAHLHPTKLNWKTFEVALPDLPGGGYSIYADVTYETGLT